MKCILAYLILFFSLHYYATGQNSEVKKFKIGFSQCTNGDLWRKTMYLEMQHELISYPQLEMTMLDAANNSNKQIRDIQRLIDHEVDLLIVSPNESKPLTKIVAETFKKGIPVILLDRKVRSSDYSAFIGGNNYTIGIEAARYANKILKGKGTVIEITGSNGSSPSQERHNGFADELAKYPNIKLVGTHQCGWGKECGRIAMRELSARLMPFDLVFAHNDEMAMGAIEEYKSQKNKKKVFFIGVDGTPGKGGGIEAISSHLLDATVSYPTGGSLAIATAWSILNMKPYSKENELNTFIIDSSNVKEVKAQTDEIIMLHKKIETSKKNLYLQIERFNSLSFWFLCSLIFLILIIILTILLFRAYRNKTAANTRLEFQKLEIDKQNADLKQISEQLEESHQARLKFFTNISHELRTPLTLILGPLETLVAASTIPSELKLCTEMMQRNANRLLQTINQLMDLRKIENEKMKLNAEFCNLVGFIYEIKCAFNDLARQKDMEYLFHTEIEEQTVLFDKDKVDKIFVNLLANAFKFTEAHGKIEICIYKTSHCFNKSTKDAIQIVVKDNGAGISENAIHQIFEPFYQEDNNKATQGTGIGLSLTKSFVELHNGEICVETQKGFGATFSVYFQLGSEHIHPNFISTKPSDHKRIEKQITPMITEHGLDMNQSLLKKGILIEGIPPLTVLLIEDNPDMRYFLKHCLRSGYNIMEASNGKEGFEKIDEHEPDLIICDVMMPVMDGLEFTRKMKSELRTCHIPIILLTARSLHEQKIEGLETGADSYLPKPFNTNHLQTRIQKLIENRNNIRHHYQESLKNPSQTKINISDLDKAFLSKCNSTIEKNLSNPEYGVEELSKEVGLSRVNVYRKIKSLTDLTVNEYIRTIRLRKAANLLKQSGKTVAEIAFECGFSSPSYFTKCFRDYFKCTPSEYLQRKNKD